MTEKKIHEINKIGAQGDVLFVRIDGEVPEAATEVTGGQALVVAHSETGHNHEIERVPGVHMYQEPSDPWICYLKLDIGVEHVDVVHHRAWDTHETLRLKGPGTYKVHRQREWTPEGLRRVQD